MTWKGCRGRWRPGAPAFRLPGPPSPVLLPFGSPRRRPRPPLCGPPASQPAASAFRLPRLPSPVLPAFRLPRLPSPVLPAFRLPGPPSPVPPPSGSPDLPAHLSRQLTPSIPLPQLLPVRRVHDSHLPARLVHYLHLHQRVLVVRHGRFPALHQAQPFPHLRQHGVLAAFRR